MPEIEWTWKPGVKMLRREVHQRFGGQERQGIVTPRSTPDVIAFTNPEKGKAYGYDEFEGLRPDGLYSYTGEGQVGDQTFKRGNAAILDRTRAGRLVRLFRSRGTEVTYVGSFTLGDPEYWTRPILDRNRKMRQGIIFNLAPIDADTELLPMYGGEILPSLTMQPWSPPDSSEFEVTITESETTRTVSRIEFALQTAFGEWLRSRGLNPMRVRLPVHGAAIEPDLYEPTSGMVVEAKKSPAREYVRLALGQVLDYAYCVERDKRKAVPAILLPTAPDDDLVAVCDRANVAVIVPSGAGFATCGSVTLDAVPQGS
jgi:hypothetical protein